ncbi:MAG: hypothetical protein SH847_17290 [Roseiflexaceae bacterium]|nr:hypothetical protein [Roseiflexaceae bacterium]
MLLKDRLRQMFVSYDPDIQRVLSEMLDLEQQNISYERPRLKEQVNDIITNVAENKQPKSGNVRISE